MTLFIFCIFCIFVESPWGYRSFKGKQIMRKFSRNGLPHDFRYCSATRFVQTGRGSERLAQTGGGLEVPWQGAEPRAEGGTVGPEKEVRREGGSP